MDDFIGYDEIIEDAMRMVMVNALKKVEEDGLQGQHYFVISFATQEKGVSIPKYLLEKYPEEMTIVIQHQFSDLKIDKKRFSIKLRFNDKPEKLVIPIASITAFSDPHVHFGIRFTAFNEKVLGATRGLEGKKSGDTHIKEGDNVISLDAFRKKDKK